MDDKPSLAVRGVACLEVPPDLARFTVSVSSRHTDRRTALEMLSERSDGIREIIDRAGPAVEKRESGGLHLWPDGDGDGIRGYAGSVTTSVVVNDFDVLGDLMTRLALREQCHVAGPYWQLRPDSAHTAEARQAAVRDGLRRARQYADSLGARIESLVDLTDTADDDPGPASAPQPAAEPGGTPSFDVELRPLTVRAEVRLRVRITPPDLTG
jgi:hypothetical protein